MAARKRGRRKTTSRKRTRRHTRKHTGGAVKTKLTSVIKTLQAVKKQV